MTTYLSKRPSRLPAFPPIDVERVDEAAKGLARAYLEQSGTPALLEHDAYTFATDRPGREAGELLTDREYAQQVLDAELASDEALAALPEAPEAGEQAAPQAVAVSKKTSAQAFAPRAAAAPRQVEAPQASGPRSDYVVNRVRIGGGQAVLNAQILRSGAFAQPVLETALPVVADRSCYAIELSGVSPGADHLDALLFAVSLIDRQPSLELGVAVSFTSHQFLSTLGWAVNAAAYERMRRVIAELECIRLTYHDRSRPRDGKTHISRVFSSISMPHADSEAQRWTVVLPGALFRIYGFGRNSVIDLQARAALRGEYGRWLHGFFSTQQAGVERVYDAEELCRAGGLNSTRLTDDFKQLRANLSVLAEGVVRNRRNEKRFRPLIAGNWSFEKDPQTHRPLVRATRLGQEQEGAALPA